ncbi:MAG: LmbE family protein [Candidatus Anammoximicrobium sp.]|nr:LmbE family protein [Candidatus Anammoximicrobium sp.]
MRLDFADERVLAVVAHPDDAELLCAGTLARAREDGAAIGVAVLCRGDKGQPPQPVPRLAAVRRGEMAAAARLLSAELFWGRIPDGTLADDRPARLRLTDIYRRFRPTLVLAHAPEDYHPDHRAASAVAEAASWFCASRGHKTRSPALSASPSLWWMDTLTMSGFEPGFYVDVSGFMAIKERMLACHRSQAARGAASDFSPVLELLRRQASTRGMQAGVAAAEAFRAQHAFKRTRAW